MVSITSYDAVKWTNFICILLYLTHTYTHTHTHTHTYTYLPWLNLLKPLKLRSATPANYQVKGHTVLFIK